MADRSVGSHRFLGVGILFMIIFVLIVDRNDVLKLLVHLCDLLLLLDHVILTSSFNRAILGRVYLGVFREATVLLNLNEIAFLVLFEILIEILLASCVSIGLWFVFGIL